MENQVVGNNKTKNILVTIIALLIITIIAVGVYFIFFKQKDESKSPDDSTDSPITNVISDDETKSVDSNTSSSTTDVISNELPLSIAKEKIEAANNFLSGFDSMHCNQSLVKEDWYCLYGLKNSFEKEFYKIYSKKLSLQDVYVEYSFKTQKESTNIVGIDENTNTNEIGEDTNFVLRYAYDGSDIYVDSSCRASGYGTELLDIKIDSLTDDRIEATYVLREGLDEVLLGITNTKEVERLTKAYNDISKFGRHKMVLIKEDDAYKIYSATLIDNCGHVYKTGK